jgi:hypothetical protein
MSLSHSQQMGSSRLSGTVLANPFDPGKLFADRIEKSPVPGEEVALFLFCEGHVGTIVGREGIASG